MADRRLVYTVEIDATQTEAAARKLREALAQITAGAGQNGQKADPAARQVESQASSARDTTGSSSRRLNMDSLTK